MPDGGGFCDKHGPYDPPHLMCPYCAMEDDQRRHYGPPRRAPAPRLPGPPTELGDPAPGDDFVRQTLEPDVSALDEEAAGDDAAITELIPREGGPPGLADDPRAPLGWLIVKEPLERRGDALPIRANQIIGRSGDVRWDDPRLSRQHARLTLEPAASPDDPPVFHLWPFGTTNPVFVNGSEIRGATPVHENDEIRLGDTLFVLKVLFD